MAAIASALGSLLVKFQATNEISPAADAAGKSIQDFTRKMPQAVQGLTNVNAAMGQLSSTAIGLAGKLIGGFGLFEIGKTAFEAAEKIEQADARIARATGATGQALENLSQSFQNVYSHSAASAESITAAMTIISQRSGVTGAALEDLTVRMIKLSKVAGEDVAALGPLVTRVFGDWSIATDKQGAAMDYLRAVSQDTGTTVSKLAETVVYAGAPLRLLGYNFEQAAALIGRFQKEGVNTELVLGGMKAALSKFAAEGVTDVSAAWQKFVEDVKTGTKTISDVMAEVGVKRGADLFKAITEGRLEIGKMTEDLQRLAKTGGASVSTLSGEFTKIKHAAEIGLGGPMLELIKATEQEIEGLERLGKTLKDIATYPIRMLAAGPTGASNVPVITPPELPTVKAPGPPEWWAKGHETATTLNKDLADAAGAARDLAKAYSTLGIEANKVREIEAALALLARGQGISGVVSAYQVLAGEFAKGAINADQFQVSLYSVGAALSALHDKAEAIRKVPWDSLFTDKLPEQIALFQQEVDALGRIKLTGTEAADAMAAFAEANLTGAKVAALLAGEPLPEWLTKVGSKAITTSEVMKELGKTSQEELDKAANAAFDLYLQLVANQKVGAASAGDVKKAYQELIDKQKEAAGITTLTAKQFKETWAGAFKQIHDAIVNDLDRAIVDLAFNISRVGDDFKKLGEDIVGIILHKIIAQGINKLLDSLANVGGVLGKLGQALGGAVSGSGSVITGAGGVLGTSVGAAGGAAGAVGSAGSAGSAAAGIVSSSITGIIGAAAGVGTLVSSIIGNFQSMAMNKSLDLIEQHTAGMLNQLRDGMQPQVNQIVALMTDGVKQYFGITVPLLTGISSSLDFVVGALADIRKWGGASGGGSGNVTYNVTIDEITISGSGSSSESAAEAVIRAIPQRLKMLSPVFAPGR